ncbi:MAG: beta-ketoacyl synthase N-terminal-like domain-containing protein [Pelovirga sp.]
MKQVVLSRVAAVTPLGEEIDSLWQQLLAGRTGIAPIRRFDSRHYISHYGACIDGLTAASGESLMVPLLDQVAGKLARLPENCRLLVATTKGEIDRLEARCRAGKPVTAEALPAAFLERVARRFGLLSPVVNINAACASSTVALARGAAMIAAGQVSAVLVYAADIVSEFVFSGFSALQALSPEFCRPFDQQRDGLNLGEAGVALLLLDEELALREQEPVLARIAGWGAANDAHHVTAPARDGCGLVLACQQAIAGAKIKPAQLCAINAHGTGTVYNDAMELTAFAALFGRNLPPLHGLKGSLGHCLGAAGGIEVAIAARALQEQLLPPTVGCQHPEATAVGRIGEQSQAISGDYLLCCNSGFGGINGALILQRIVS